MVIGVKKGWPNFNELSIETDAQVTRKLAAHRPGGRIDTNIQFRQMFVVGVSNVFAIAQQWGTNRLTADVPVRTVRPPAERRLKKVGEGKSNAEISATLYLSVPTVKTHVSRILTKLDLNNRVQIALLVHDAGLLHD